MECTVRARCSSGPEHESTNTLRLALGYPAVQCCRCPRVRTPTPRFAMYGLRPPQCRRVNCSISKILVAPGLRSQTARRIQVTKSSASRSSRMAAIVTPWGIAWGISARAWHIPLANAYPTPASITPYKVPRGGRDLTPRKRIPSVAFVRQANIAHGPQQVNNRMSTHSRARENEITPSKLLEANNGERMDTGAASSPGRVNQELETVGTIDRTANSSGKGKD